jgi:hypothetical protein
MDDLQQTLDEAIRAYKSGDAALQWQPLSWCGKSLAFTTPLTAGLAFRRGAFMTRSMHTTADRTEVHRKPNQRRGDVRVDGFRKRASLA